MKKFCFTVDDNIIFCEELTKGSYNSLFEHPYLAFYKELHDKFDIKVQLNMFYRKGGYDLSMMTDKFKDEWKEASDWLKLSFHSIEEAKCFYTECTYDEMYTECKALHDEVIRFAGETSLAETTTVHYCQSSKNGLKAMRDLGIKGVLGLFGTDASPRTSYGISLSDAAKIRSGEMITIDGITHHPLDIVLNKFSTVEILAFLKTVVGKRETVSIMIHEQYFYPFYKAYQPDFKEKIFSAVKFLCENGYKGCLLEEMI